MEVGGGKTFRQDMLAIGSRIAEPFKPAYRKTAKWLKRQEPKLDVAEEKVREFIQPKTQQEERLVRESAIYVKEADIYSKNVEKYNKEVLEFNKEFKDVTTQKELVKYEKERLELEKKQSILKRQESAVSSRGSFIERREEQLNIEKERAPTTLVAAALTGLVLFPITTAKLGVGLVTVPVKTIKGEVTAIKQLPKSFAQRPLTTAGELIGNIAGAVITGRIVGSALKKTPKLTTEQALLQAKNKALGLSDKYKVETIGFTEQTLIRNKLIKTGAFSEDINIQGLIKTSQVGKITRKTPSGKTSTRYIIKQTSRNKEVILTFKESPSGKVSSPRVSVTDKVKGITEVYRPAKPSEVKTPTLSVEQLRQTGTYAKTGRIVSQLEKPLGEKTLRLTKKQATIFKVGYGSGEVKTIADILGKRKTPKVTKLVKEPKPIAEAQFKTLELLEQPKDIIASAETDIIKVLKKLGERQKGMIYEKGTIKPIEPIKLDIQKVPKPSKPFETKGTKADINKIIKQSQEKVKQFQQVPQQVQKQVQDLSSVYSPQELGFDIRQFKPTTLKPVSKKVVLPAKVSVLDTKQDISIDTQQVQQLIKPKVKIKEKLKKEIYAPFPTITDIQTSVQSQIKIPIKEKIKIPIKMKPPVAKLKPLPLPAIQVPVIPTPIIPKIRTPIIPPPFLPRGTPRGAKQQKAMLKKRVKRIPKYTASLAAAAFQFKPVSVTPEQYKKLHKRTWTGMEVRPVIAIKKEKKKFYDINEEEDVVNFNKKLKKVQF